MPFKTLREQLISRIIFLFIESTHNESETRLDAFHTEAKNVHII